MCSNIKTEENIFFDPKLSIGYGKMRQLSESRLERTIVFYKKICEILNHAFLITAHTCFEQLEEILCLQRTPDHSFYINMDRD